MFSSPVNADVFRQKLNTFTWNIYLTRFDDCESYHQCHRHGSWDQSLSPTSLTLCPPGYAGWGPWTSSDWPRQPEEGDCYSKKKLTVVGVGEKKDTMEVQSCETTEIEVEKESGVGGQASVMVESGYI